MERPFRIEELLAQAGWLRALAASLVSDPARADDLVQDTWVAALRRPPASDGSPRPWLARVVHNLARNARRGEERRAAHEGFAREERPESTPASIAQQAEAQRLLADAVARLAEPLRAVIVLRYFQGLDSAAIGRELALPPSTVRSRVQKALEELRAELDRKFEGGRAAWMAFLGGRWRPSPLAKTATGAASIAGRLAPLVAGALVVAVGAATWELSRPRGAQDARRSASISFEQEHRAASAIPTTDPNTESTASVSSSQRTAIPAEAAARGTPAPQPTSDSNDSAVVYIDGRVADRPVEFEIPQVLDAPSLFVRSDAQGNLRPAEPLSSGRQMRASGFEPEAGGLFPVPRRSPDRELQVRLLSCPVVTGRVLDADSRQPLAFVLGAFEAKWSSEEAAGSFSLRFQTDDEGRFQLALVAGERLRARLLFEAPEHGRRFVEIPEFVRAESLDLGDIVLEPARAVAFRVLDVEGRPIARARIQSDDIHNFGLETVTDADGKGELRCVSASGSSFRFGAAGCEDTVLRLQAGDSPSIVLERATALEIQIVSRAPILPPVNLRVTASTPPFAGKDGLCSENLFPGTPCRLVARSATSVTLDCQPDGKGRVDLVGLRPDLALEIEVRDTDGSTLAVRGTSVAPHERQRLEIPLGP